MHDHPGLILALIGLAGILAQWLSWWLKMPAILFLLLLGILAGPATGVVRPDELFGDLLFPLVSLGVAVILFEGSLTLRFHEIRGSLEGAVRNLVSIGALINWGLISFAVAWLMDFSWDLALLFGALMTVTGPTVIVPMLRSVRPRKRVADTLRWEGIIIDPVGALLAVLVFEAISVGTEENTLTVFALSVGIGSGAGILGALVLGHLLRRHWLPEYLHNVGALTLVLAIFTVSNTFQEESGLLAVTVMGIALANMKVPTEDILNFKESLSVLLISGLFIVLAARMDFAQFKALDWNALYLLGAIIFIARPVAVFIATIGSGLNWREKTLISWIGPRGIVAAAITPLFVLKLNPDYYHHTELLMPLVFLVIVGTVVLQSFTARPLALLLKVADPDPRGVLIVGANTVARAVAQALAEHGYYSLLADTNWSQLKAARMAGLKTYFGSPVSAHADRHLDLVGLGRLFAMSRHPALNALACIRYQREFGAKNVFTFRAPEEGDPEDESAASKRSYQPGFRGRRLFGAEVTYARMANLLNEGGVIRSTLLTEDFGYQSYKDLYPEAICLFALDPKGVLQVFNAEAPLDPLPGWTIVSLLPPRAVREAKTGIRNGNDSRKQAKESARTEIARHPDRGGKALP